MATETPDAEEPAIGTSGSRLLALFGSRRLSPAQRLIAHYLVENPREALFLTSNELGDRVGVSQPSVTRFAIALGYDGYASLKEQMQAVLLESADTSTEPNAYERAVDAAIRNLRALRSSLADPSAVIELGQNLASSDPLVILGLRSSASVASGFGFFCEKIHPHVRTITEAGSVAIDKLAEARQAGAEWLVVFLLPRYPRETLDLLEVSRNLGYHIGVVTDSAQAPVAALAHTTLLAATGTGLVFDSHEAPMLLATVLLDAIADTEPARSRSRLEDFDRRANDHKIFGM